MNRKSLLTLLFGFAMAIFPALSADPPPYINYQGVLRDAADRPLDGAYDFLFLYYSAGTGGDLILTEDHTSGGSVPVRNGLFNVQLGVGCQDGPGPGTYTSLAQVFRDYSAVWLEVEVGPVDAPRDRLTPRTQVVSAAYAMNASNLQGRPASGFIDTTGAPQLKLGPLEVNTLDETTQAVRGAGYGGGGFFGDWNNSGYAYVGYGDYGIKGHGSLAGGYFKDTDQSAEVYVALGEYGVYGMGNDAGGYFLASNDSGYALLGSGATGVWGYGSYSGGYFSDTSGSSRVSLALGTTGIVVYTNSQAEGAFFGKDDNSAQVTVLDPPWGIVARGDGGGVHGRATSGSGWGTVGHGDWGVEGYGNSGGGYFKDADNSGYAYVGYADRGIEARGNVLGGFFADSDSSAYAWVAGSTSKIQGSGSVDFVQNHPYDASRVIVYTAPEGDEVATYTRGTARLQSGEARVPLGETFAWVTNPDIGLTAYVVPREECRGLLVASLTTRELVVRELGGGRSDAAFDFLVFGLRIGFEETTVVQPKEREAFIPSMADHRSVYEKQPELRAYNAHERFGAMRSSVWGAGVTSSDSSASRRLRDAVHEYDPASDPPVHVLLGRESGPPPETPRQVERAAPVEPDSTGSRQLAKPPETPRVATTPLAAPTETAAERPEWSRFESFPVSEAVEVGDLLALDGTRGTRLRKAAAVADPAVIGIVAGATMNVDGEPWAPLALYGVATVKADASYGPILAGELLVSSPTPGHAMRAAAPLPGTVIGKALEPLEVGTGLIKVLVMPR